MAFPKDVSRGVSRGFSLTFPDIQEKIFNVGTLRCKASKHSYYPEFDCRFTKTAKPAFKLPQRGLQTLTYSRTSP